jgi:glycosyltransferase involved in cell wall biosynthesis
VKISAVILTRDEEKNIVDCINSLRWVDEVVVLDSFSTDHTVSLAQEAGARVVQHRFINYAHQRNVGISIAQHEWVFFVDADERATPELAAEVRAVTATDEYAGFWVPRRNYIFGRWIRHAGWYPDYQPRLLRVGKTRWDHRRPVHELVIFDGPAGYLQNTLIHYNYKNLGQFFVKQNVYSTFEAQRLFSEGQRARPHNFALQPLREFRRRYVTLEGYKDGGHGLLLSLLMAYYTGVVYAKLWQLQRQSGRRNH